LEIVKRLGRLAQSLVKLKWTLAPPKSGDVLLYFKTGQDEIAPYFKPEEFRVLDLRESAVSIFIALRCLMQGDLSAENYARQFIRRVDPKLIITFIDNFPPIYLLKDEFPEITVWLIQNGHRSGRGDLFGLLSTEYQNQINKVDVMFVFGQAVGKMYRQYIAGEVVDLGSLKNNIVKQSNQLDGSIAYISTYRPNQDRGFVVPESEPGKPVTYETIIRRREQVIFWLAEYCNSHNRKLVVVGKDESPHFEHAYYQTLLRGFEFDFVGKSSSTSSYEAIDKAEIVVFTSSTLGYESLARGKKTAAIMLDAEIIGATALKFGWPKDLPSDGEFWTNRLDKNRFVEILDYLRTVTEEDWRTTCSATMHDIIEFNPNNTKFVEKVLELRKSGKLQVRS